MCCSVFAAFAVDFGLAYNSKAELQNTADAAALAGAQKLPNSSDAISTAKDYAALNGVPTSETSVTIPYDGSPEKLEVVCSETVNCLFAQVFGISENTISARAVAQKTSGSGGNFNYLIYSGNTYPGGFSVRRQNILTMTGSNHNIYGDVHSNYEIDISGSSTTITGACEAVGDIDYGSNNVTNPVTGASFVPMPDFSSAVPTIKAQAQAAGQYFSGDFDKNDCGSTLNITQPVYVEGDANLSGISFSGQGCIYVEGEIKITGTSTSYTSDSMICMYSNHTSARKSDYAIDFSGSNKDFKGMLYAPKGGITVTGSDYNFNGSIIGTIVDIAGSQKNFYEADTSATLPYGGESKITLIE